MTCKEFKDRLPDLFDKDVSPQLLSKMEQHMNRCSKCRIAYEEIREVFTLLQPSAESQREIEALSIVKFNAPKDSSQYLQPASTVRKNKAWWAVAAGIAFLLGVFVGISNLFTTPATAASPNAMALFNNAITYVQNVGSFKVEVYARTRPQENFYSLFINEGFVKAELQLLRQGDSVFYRVERAGDVARVLMCDGRSQYMWVGDNKPVRGALDYNFLGIYHNMLYPDQLLQMQKSAIEVTRENHILRSETDSTIIIMVEGFEWDSDLQILYDKGHKDTNKVTIENVFSKSDGLLRSVRYWVHKDGNKILALYTGAIQYNPMLSRNTITAMPHASRELAFAVVPGSPLGKDKMYALQSNGANIQEVRSGRLQQLQGESSVDAAKRIMSSLSSGHTDDIKEAFSGIEDELPDLTESFSGCKYHGFSKRTSEDYAGEYVYFHVQYPDGEKKLCHISLRNDNEQHIWIFDGGL